MKALSISVVVTSFFVFITLGFGVCTALASQGGGRVTLEGQIVDSACALDASSAYQLVEFDPLPMGQLIRQGQSLPVIYTLR